MKTALTSIMALFLLSISAQAYAPNDIGISDLDLAGRIEGENIFFELCFTAEVKHRDTEMLLVSGDVAYMDGSLPRKSKLVRTAEGYKLRFSSTGRQPVVFRFAARPVRDGYWFQTGFEIPISTVRTLSVLCDRDDLEIVFPGALDTRRSTGANGQTTATAYLGLTDRFSVRWKPEPRKLDADLVLSCEANTMAVAGAGAMKIDTVLTYRIVQGTLKNLAINLPPQLNVTQIIGQDIRDWTVEDGNEDKRLLRVALGRQQKDTYLLRIQGEMTLPDLPCEFDLPLPAPTDTIRTSGFLMVGTDSAVKMSVVRAAGLSQIDQKSFPVLNAVPGAHSKRKPPARILFSYQYANMPCLLSVTAEDIVTALSADERLCMTISDNTAVLEASVELDVRDAPTRNVVVDVDPGWTVVSADGACVSDSDIREDDGKRVIRLHFMNAVLGRALIDIKLERNFGDDRSTITTPSFSIRGAKTERGYIVLAAEEGLLIDPLQQSGTTEAHTGSIPVSIPDAQYAYRFKDSNWSISMNIERTRSTIHTEILHLVSVGEGALYCSASVTYHIDGAPTRELAFFIPERFQNVDFTGRNIRTWHRDGNKWTVSLQEKVMGDYTLLITYDEPFDYSGGEIMAGNLHTIGTESEVGYLVVTSGSGMDITPLKLDPSIHPIDRSEIPKAYSLLINSPVLAACKYFSRPHGAVLKAVRHTTYPLLSQVADYTSLSTRISMHGETVTTARYSVKNMSRQYLVLSLPENARLWSVRRREQDGLFEEMPAQQTGKNLLIPIPRLRDPNMVIQVEVVYAEAHGEPGPTGKAIALAAPALPETRATFTEWNVETSDDLALAGCTGSMFPAGNDKLNSPARLLPAVLHIYRSLPCATSLWIILAGAILTCMLMTLFHGRYRWGAIAVLILVPILVSSIAIHINRGPRTVSYGRALLRQFMSNQPVSRTALLTRPINIDNSKPLAVTAMVTPAWIGNASRYWTLIMPGLGLAGILVLLGTPAKRRGLTSASIGITLMVFSMAQVAAGRSILSWVLAIMAPTACIMVVRKVCCFAHARLRTAHTRRDRMPSTPVTDTHADLPYADPDSPPFSRSPTSDPLVEPGDASNNKGNSGGYSFPMFLLPLAGILLALTALASPETRTCDPGSSTAEQVNVRIENLAIAVAAPSFTNDANKSALIKMEMSIATDDPVTLKVLPANTILTDFTSESRYVSIDASRHGYLMRIERRGLHDTTLAFLAPVISTNGERRLALNLPKNVKNTLTLDIPDTDIDVHSDTAIVLTCCETNGSTLVNAVFGSAGTASLTWAPRIRETKLEKAVFFCDIATVADFQQGVVEIRSSVRHQIAQGELKELSIRIPEGMSVTSVRARELSTWRYDPATGVLEAILKRPVAGGLTLFVTTQIPCEGLPYDAIISPMEALGANRHRGIIALSGPETVTVHTETTSNLHPMNIEDFVRSAVCDFMHTNALSSRQSVRRAFRYNRLPASLAVHADPVVPEIRVDEKSVLSVSDERLIMSSSFSFEIVKAGVFSLRLSLPDGFDIETLSGPEISHWDDIEKPDRGILVHFRNKVRGKTTMNAVISKVTRGIDRNIDTPCIRVPDARKHTGYVVISGEPGLRMVSETIDGATELRPEDVGLRTDDALAFKILRPGWIVTLKTETMAPVIRPEILQRVDIAEGLMRTTAYIRYRIENAGCKTFRIKAPEPGISLSVSGRDIAQVAETDKEAGIWEIVLHNKVQNNYSLTITSQKIFDMDAGTAIIRAFQTPGAERQKGYLAVMTDGLAQIEPTGRSESLQAEDPRSVPGEFGAGDLSNALYCYRMVRPDAELTVSVTRHETAGVLPSEVKSVRMASVMSNSGHLLTQARLRLAPGTLRFLKMTLPLKTDVLWSAFVNGIPCRLFREGNSFRIPVAEDVTESAFTVELVYASPGPSPTLEYHAPTFNLPLKNVTWDFFVPPDRHFYGFGGSMHQSESTATPRVFFNSNDYAASNLRRMDSNLATARSVMARGERYAREGKQQEAKQALQKALTYSQGQADMNEDARVQYRNLIRHQAVVGLVNRRCAVRGQRNIIDDKARRQTARFKEGNFTTEDAIMIEQSLSTEDNRALQAAAERIMEQQSAAEKANDAIQIAIPEHGEHLRFTRALQIDPDSVTGVVFKTGPGLTRKTATVIIEILLVFAAVRVLLACYAASRGKRNAA